MRELEPKSKIQVITEEVDPARMIHAVMHNYPNAQSAFMELVDNSIDNRIEGHPLRIQIRVRDTEIFIANIGGEGLDIDGLRNFFTWGMSEKREKIGQYGQGGKAAMGYLGDGLKVTCSSQDSDVAYTVADPNWREGREGGLKTFIPRASQAVSNEGYFNATISRIPGNKKINPGSLIRRLGEEYRPLLVAENGDEPRVTITVNGNRVEPLEIPYVEEENLAKQTYRKPDRLGNKTIISVGILKSDNTDIKSGIRCYYHGKLVASGELFGISSTLPGSTRLTGEAHLDFVPVTANKSDFDKDSDQWKAAFSSIEQLLKDHWLEKLKSLPTENLHHPGKDEIRLAKQLKTEFEDFLKSSNFFTRREVPGSSSGREPSDTPQPHRPEHKGGTHSSPEGKTPPGETASEGKDKVKRWGPFDEWLPTPLGNSFERSTVVKEDNKIYLKINTDFRAYQKALKAGMNSLEFYFTETIAMEIARHVRSDSVEEYIEYFNDLIRQFNEYKDTKTLKKKGDVFVRQR